LPEEVVVQEFKTQVLELEEEAVVAIAPLLALAVAVHLLRIR
jgi:hypothetical protein